MAKLSSPAAAGWYDEAMKKSPRRNVIELTQLRPTQVTVGMLQVRHKQKRLKELVRRPSELVDFILEHPIVVVLGPAAKVYVIDHHHLALALIREKFETAPMNVEDDFSALPLGAFWKKMQAKHFVHAYDAKGQHCAISAIPLTLRKLKDDPFRSLAGFAREAGGFNKVPAPFAEFLWADYFRIHIHRHLVEHSFHKALKHALKLARLPEAAHLPGYKGKR